MFDLSTSPLPYWYYFASVLGFNSVIFLLATAMNDLSIVDPVWSIMFLIPNALEVYARRNEVSDVMKLTGLLVTIWAVRLSLHIGLKHEGEDERYKVIARRWAHRGPVGKLISAFLWVFGLQGFLSVLVNASALHIMRFSPKD